MKKIIFLALFLVTSLAAKINVVTTYSYLGELVKEIGKDEVNVNVLGNPKFDPHFIVPKPSLITKLRAADLLIINGGQLEIGWLPPLLRGAQNKKINMGANGFLDVSGVIDMLDKPDVLSRASGDVHPDGNPHFALDPHNITIIAKLIAKKLIMIDRKNTAIYENNLAKFLQHWEEYLKQFDIQMAQCQEKRVIEYHELFRYFLKRYNLISFGNIEPLPGISPSSQYTFEMINIMKDNGVKTILQDVYHEKKTAQFLADKTGATVVVLPHDIGSVEEANTLENFYNLLQQKICR